MGNTQQKTTDLSPPGGMQIEGVPSGKSSDVKSEIKMTIQEARKQAKLREEAKERDRKAKDQEFERKSGPVVQKWLALFIDALHKEAPKHAHTVGLMVAAKDTEYYCFNVTVGIPGDLAKQILQLGCGSLVGFIGGRCDHHSHGESGIKMCKKMCKEVEDMFGIETYFWGRNDVVNIDQQNTIVIGVQLSLYKQIKIDCYC